MTKIAMMAAWNTDSGVAIHAEPIGKAWIQMGHDLRVFTFLKDDYHGEEITADSMRSGLSFPSPNPSTALRASFGRGSNRYQSTGS
jgi:hypothetical protein